jgi:amidophosphoribosyltransferase
MPAGGRNLKTWHDECGVFGIWNHPDASRLTYLGLYAIQHRGQESAGIVSLDGERHYIKKGLGLVGEVFDDESFQSLPGRAAIGHVRYSTTGRNSISNAQPLHAELHRGPFAISHNGNIVNAGQIKEQLKNLGSIFQGTNDTEIVLHLMARNSNVNEDKNENFVQCLLEVLERLDGAFSFTMLSHQTLFAARDPYGFRPLVLGVLESDIENGVDGPAYVLASETCAFDLIGAKYIREIEPGELFWVDESGPHSVFMRRKVQARAACVFEHIYFARPDSVIFGASVYETRKRAGRILSRECSVAADLVVPVPDSGLAAAIGYSAESGIPFELGIIRNHYIGRTFIQPQQSIRDFGVKIKLNPQAEVLKGKRVIVIDDSLVRGTTSKKIVGLVRAAGASEVHLRIAAPPTTGPCYYGVDTPERSQLIAANQSLEEIRSFVGADTLGYLSLKGMKEAVAVRGVKESDVEVNASKGFCSACFDGHYPSQLYGLDTVPKGNIRGI